MAIAAFRLVRMSSAESRMAAIRFCSERGGRGISYSQNFSITILGIFAPATVAFAKDKNSCPRKR